MALYVMLTNLTDEGRKTIKSNPDRIKEVNKEVEAMGVRIMAQYALIGPYDFINILEAPDSATINRVAVEVGSRRTLQTMTLPALTLDDFIKGLKPRHLQTIRLARRTRAAGKADSKPAFENWLDMR